MSTKLYVGNLDYGVTSEQLGEHFAQVGTVTDTVVLSDKYSGRSKGFGFVTMSKPEEAEKAIFNGAIQMIIGVVLKKIKLASQPDPPGTDED